jgi:MFS family permease
MADQGDQQHTRTGPRFFYGYVVVAAAFIIMVVSWGMFNAFGVFFNPLTNEFGWSRTTISGAFSVSMILSGLLGMVAGKLNDRFGPRIVLTICGLLLGLGYVLMSQTNAPWQLYLFLGVIVGIGMGGVWVPLLSSIARWFVSKRSLMTGIAIAGIGLGRLIGPPAVNLLISTYDWRISYIILGGVVLICVVLVAQFLKRDPAKIRQLPYDENQSRQSAIESDAKGFSLKGAVGTTQFWLVLTMFLTWRFGAFAFTLHIVPHIRQLEISAFHAANILAVTGGVGILGNYLLGSLGDRIGNRNIFVIGFVLMFVSLFLLMLARELWMLYVISGVLGFGCAGLASSESPLAARLFGLRSHGLIFGVLGLGATAGASVGPIVTGYMFDLTNSYQAAFLVCAALTVVGLMLAIVLRPTKELDGRI